MKLPNGYGSIVNLGKHRRKPFAVRITVGKKRNSKGQWVQQYKYLEYFEKKTDALTYLANYNADHVVKEHIPLTSVPSFREFYDEWLAYRQSAKHKLADETVRNYNIAFNRFENVHDKKISGITYQELQEVLTANNDKSKTTIGSMRALLKGMYGLAIKKGLLSKDITELLHFEWTESTTKIHSRFSDDEIRLLWKHCYKMHNVDAILIAIYTGLRPQELCEMLTENVFLDEQYMIGGMKTAAGTNRTIPICDRILPLVKARCSENRKYMISNKFGNHYTYGVFYDSFVTVMKKLNIKHNPHDCRYTFASLADNVCMNEVCLKNIMGHSIQDITKGVYTDKTKVELLAEVQKLNNLF